MEPELLGLLLAVVCSGLPAAAARFLRRRKLSVDDSPQRAQVSADATLAEAADIARADGATEVRAVTEHRAVGKLRVPQAAIQTASRAGAKRFDITFADVAYSIAVIVGIGAKAIWDYENKYHKPGINWLQVNLAPGSSHRLHRHRQPSENWLPQGRWACPAWRWRFRTDSSGRPWPPPPTDQRPHIRAEMTIAGESDRSWL